MRLACIERKLIRRILIFKNLCMICTRFFKLCLVRTSFQLEFSYQFCQPCSVWYEVVPKCRGRPYVLHSISQVSQYFCEREFNGHLLLWSFFVVLWHVFCCFSCYVLLCYHMCRKSVTSFSLILSCNLSPLLILYIYLLWLRCVVTWFFLWYEG